MNRAEYSQARIEELGDRLAPVEELLRDEPLCIYATGSYARLEAGEESDIDIFFLYEGHPLVQRLPNLTLIQLSACLIDATREMGFPPFSEDGRYLDVHYLDHMEEVLGSPDDDSLNAFTARMLLLLESRPVYGAERYENYKLKLSRLATCFSTILHLASEEPPVEPERVRKLCGLTPRERFESLRGVGNEEADKCIETLLSTYDAFLDQVQRPRPKVLEDFHDEEVRRNRLAEAGDFGEKIFELLTLLVPPERLRHLVV